MTTETETISASTTSELNASPSTCAKCIADRYHNLGGNLLGPMVILCPFHAAAPAMYAALQNLAYCGSRISPPPYGHKCQWCGECVARARADARAALALVDGKQEV